MADEREVKKETDWLGREREYIYEKGSKVGEVHTEKRGGFLGTDLGAESHRVERDLHGKETGYSKTESRGGFAGFGDKPTEVHYNHDGRETGTSQSEERGGFFALGGERVRVTRDGDGNATAETHWEKRGGILGIGGAWVHVTRPVDRKGGGGSGGGGGTRYSRGGHSSSGYSGRSMSNGGTWVLVVLAAITGLLIVGQIQRRPETGQATQVQQPLPAPQQERMLGLSYIDWASIQLALAHLGHSRSPIDGVPGTATRQAISSWQSSIRRNPTGYLSGPEHKALLSKLRKKIHYASFSMNLFRNFSWGDCRGDRIKLANYSYGIATFETTKSRGRMDAFVTNDDAGGAKLQIFRSIAPRAIGGKIEISLGGFRLTNPTTGQRVTFHSCR